MGNTVSRSSSRDLGILVFDGQCGFCRRSVEIMCRFLRYHPRVVAWQEANLTQLGLNPEQCQDAVQWVSDFRGTRREHLAAADAIGKVLRNAGGGWRLLGVFMMLPGVHWFAGVVYRWVARSR